MTLVSTPFSLIPPALAAELPVSPDHGSLKMPTPITRATASHSVPPCPEVPGTPVLPRVLSLGRQEDQGLERQIQTGTYLAACLSKPPHYAETLFSFAKCGPYLFQVIVAKVNCNAYKAPGNAPASEAVPSQ